MTSGLHCLRRSFTRALARRLGEGGCINLISPHGQGRRRTLDDLRRCLPAAMPALQTNLRHDPQSLSTLLADLTSQAGFDDTDSLEDLLDRLAQRPGRTLIILHNFDELQPGPASGFDDAFFAALNATRGRSGIALLCVTEHMPTDWPLHLDSMPLPPLGPDQILAELARRDPPVPQDTWAAIADWMAGQPAPYALLEQPENWPTIRR
jgi:hypothetical protein